MARKSSVNWGELLAEYTGIYQVTGIKAADWFKEIHPELNANTGRRHVSEKKARELLKSKPKSFECAEHPPLMVAKYGFQDDGDYQAEKKASAKSLKNNDKESSKSSTARKKPNKNKATTSKNGACEQKDRAPLDNDSAKQPHDATTGDTTDAQNAQNKIVRCGATNRTGGQCQLVAGFGTDHVGEGRCKFHGGLSPGAPRGNRNAETHGIYRSYLSDAEQEIYDDMADTRQLDISHEIRLVRIQLIRATNSQRIQMAYQEDGEYEKALELQDSSSKDTMFGPEVTKSSKLVDYNGIIDRLMGRLTSLLKAQRDMASDHRMTADERQSIIYDLVQLVRARAITAEEAGLELDSLGIDPPPTLKARIFADLAEPDAGDDGTGLDPDELDEMWEKAQAEKQKRADVVANRSELIAKMEAGEVDNL